MDKIKTGWVRAMPYVKKHWFILFTVVTYFFFTVYYMGTAPTLTDCGNTLNGFGDNTAGPVWKMTYAGDTPIGGSVSVTNYPSGESLNSPIDVVVAGQSVVLWATAKIAGPVCGYNIANILGYMSASLVMFGFIYVLTKRNRWVAWLAGFAVAFTPYYQAKIGGHPSYGFQALLIGVLWAFFSLITTRKKSRAVLLALLLALCFYFDPYFSLLSMTIITPLVLTWLVVRLIRSRRDKVNKKRFIEELKMMGLSVGVFTLSVLPLPIIMVSQSSQISMLVSGTRDNVALMAQACSNLPHEYLLPFPHSPFFEFLGGYEQKIREVLYAFSQCGLGEDVVGISVAMVAVVSFFAAVLIWEKRRRGKTGLTTLLGYDARLVVVGVAALALVAITLALPPVKIGPLSAPSLLLVETTSIWRVVAREYVVLNIAVVVLFSVALVYFAKYMRFGRVGKAILYLLLFILLLVQYQTYRPFQGDEANKFSYSNAPGAYYWLKQRIDIGEIAEYPIEKATEANSHGYYISMQRIHNKSLLNSALSVSSNDGIHSAIKNLADPQTISVLHSLGIDAIVVHGVDMADLEKIPYLKVVYQGNHKPDGRYPESKSINKDTLIVAKIMDTTPVLANSLQFMSNLPRNADIQPSAVDWQYEIPTETKISLRQLPAGKNETEGKVCFAVKMASVGDVGTLYIRSESGEQTATLTDQYRKLVIQSKRGENYTLASDNGHNMRMTNLGCSE